VRAHNACCSEAHSGLAAYKHIASSPESSPDLIKSPSTTYCRYMLKWSKVSSVISSVCWSPVPKMCAREYSTGIHIFSKCVVYCVGFEVFTAVVMKSIVFWDMMPCSPLSFNRCFRRTYRLHLQGRRNRFSKPAEDGGDMFLQNGWNSTGYTASYPRRWYFLWCIPDSIVFWRWCITLGSFWALSIVRYSKN
jgi:hypothetical protein